MAEPDQDPLATTSGWGRWRWPFTVLVGAALVVGVVLRFVSRSPLWLDETLSVNIARLPLGDIPEALRHDGHPPLYYWLLHGWMALFGQGSVAVRAFSGLWGLALFPLVWVAARRLGGRRVAIYAVALLALSPYAIRYAAETRMYAMVSVLALAGWLLADDALRSPRPIRLAGVAATVALLVWTHYWAIWFLGAAAAGLVVHGWRARRAGRADDVGATARVLGAMVVGGLTFIPWVPSLLYQGAHTGTPWARPLRPTEMVIFTLSDFGGGPRPEGQFLGWLLSLALVVGLFGAARDRLHVDLDVRTRPAPRPFAILIAGTLALACVVGYATGATYATRYAAVFFPFFLLLAALGVDQLRSRPIVVGTLAVLLALGGAVGALNVTEARSDAARSADAIEAAGEPGDLVVYCPDQLGPATSRLLDAGFDQVTFPELAPPELVDWVDYKARLRAVTPEAFAQEVLDRAGPRQIFFVYSTNYETHRDLCPAIYNALGVDRVPEVLTQPSDAYEWASVVRFTPRPS
ncbi:MAG: glycosyltransferase family 39 protein [Acidimicrobiales bacterium]